jgi:penicillin-binding protein 1A
MVGIMEGVVQSGTARRLKVLNRPVAGKTGTTNDYKDAWFIGYTPDLVVGSYVGFDQPRNMGRSATGGGLAAPIVRDFLSEALEGVPAVPFRAPPGAVLVKVNHKTGRPARGGPGVIMETFKPGQMPAGAVGVPVEGDAQAAPGEAFPEFPDAAQAAPPPSQYRRPRRAAPPPSSFPTPGAGGLY